MARIVAKSLPEARRLKPVEVVHEYEKTLLDELDLRREAANAIQLRRNFEGSEELYVPEVIPDLSSETLMVSERIYGIQVSDIETLNANGTNMKLLAERGVTVFFTQVFRDSFSMQTCTRATYSLTQRIQITLSGLVWIVALSARSTAKISAI